MKIGPCNFRPASAALGVALLALTLAPPAPPAGPGGGGGGGAPPTASGEYVAHDFHFTSGETLAELRLHYTTLGQPHRDARGRVDNAVLILHGTGGSGHSFLQEKFAGVLFGPGQPLDAKRYFIVLPDGIGHGDSSKPSDGLHMRFPRYDYADMVAAQYALLVDGLQVDHLRLVMGTSMGCMHTFLWGEMHAEFVDALMPLACLPVPIAGRNRVWRQLILDSIRGDPNWRNGEYQSEPEGALGTAAALLMIAGSAPLPFQVMLPTPAAAAEFVHKYLERELPQLDANDLYYQIDASRDYDPSAGLEKIGAPLMWVNSADDFVNPPELGIAQREVTRIPRGRFVLLPASERTHGHGSHTWAVLWQDHLQELLAESAPRAAP